MTDEDYMRRALHLAEKGRNTVRHGAMVGAVAVQGDRILGEGFHPAPGEPHAEVFALGSALGRGTGFPFESAIG